MNLLKQCKLMALFPLVKHIFPKSTMPPIHHLALIEHE